MRGKNEKSSKMSKRKAKDSGSASILDFFGKSKRSTHEVREHLRDEHGVSD